MERASDTHAIGITRSSQSPELCFEMSVALWCGAGKAGVKKLKNKKYKYK